MEIPVIGLILLPLVLAAAFDSEGKSEEDWAKRFAEVDALRTSMRVRPLTARERMSLVIGGSFGKKPKNVDLESVEVPEYLVGYVAVGEHGTTMASISWYLIVLQRESDEDGTFWNEIHRRLILQHHWDLCSEESVQEVRMAREQVEEWARKLLLPFEPFVRHGERIDSDWMDHVEWPL